MAWFTFTDSSQETFVVRLDDPAEIAHARAIVAGTTTADLRIAGTVVKSEAAYNIGWSYHLDPDSIFFFEVSTEVGDSTMRFIEDHLAEVGGALLPGSVWTPWTSELLDELRAKSGDADADVLIGTRKADILFGRAGNDLLLGLGDDDHLVGGAGRDTAFGGRGHDKLGGGAGDDLLWGGPGHDLLDGGTGDDWLRGGRGNDTFQFAEAGRSGREVVCDFGTEDVIRLDESWLDGLADRTGDGSVDAGDVAASFRERGDHLVLRLDSDTAIVLKGLAGHTLAAGDFLIG
jgi:Ca2+-binding RTX toxin-like protein